MYELSESALDRHFESQQRIMGCALIENVNKANFMISQRWLQRFHRASSAEKYARNCLMLLMYGQLREMGKLTKPFVEVHNVEASLEDVLHIYQSSMDNEASQQQKLELHTDAEVAPNRLPQFNDTTDDLSSFGGSLRSAGSQLLSLKRHSEPTEDTEFERRSLENRMLLKEIDSLHARTLENEEQFKLTNSSIEHKITQSQLPMHGPRSTALMLRIEQSVRLAMSRLKHWPTADKGPLNFLAICLNELLVDEPDIRAQLPLLDRKLEHLLHNMFEHAAERREKNLRIVYDQLFKQQQEMLEAKQQLLSKEQQTVIETRKQLQAHMKEFELREQLHWERQADAATQCNPEQLRLSGGGGGAEATDVAQNTEKAAPAPELLIELNFKLSSTAAAKAAQSA